MGHVAYKGNTKAERRLTNASLKKHARLDHCPRGRESAAEVCQSRKKLVLSIPWWLTVGNIYLNVAFFPFSPLVTNNYHTSLLLL